MRKAYALQSYLDATLIVMLTLAFTACSGSRSTLPITAVPEGVGIVQSDGIAPEPANESVLIDDAALDSTEVLMSGSTSASGWPANDPQPNQDLASSRARTESDYGNADAGIGGLSILPNGLSLTNIVAQHTIYHGAEGGQTPQLTLLDPVSNQIGDVLLYAPTMHPPNGSCLEAGTAYYNGGSYTDNQTHMYIYAYDFCGGPSREIHPDTVPGWFDTYVRRSPDGFPEYTVQICNCIAPTIWSQRYYNYRTHRFDTFYKTSGTYTGFGDGGWTQFETKYNVPVGTLAPCSPNLPSIEESNVRFYSGRRPIFLDATNSSLDQPEPGETSFGAYGDCFNSNVTPASYRFTLPYGTHRTWQVVSTGH
jgi:hypothetical protein